MFVGGALLVAVIGMYWDISLHIDNGRDPGPLANPAHYLILFGLFGVFVAGLLGMALPEPGKKPSATAVRLTGDWYAPLGAVLMTACAGFALSGFPLDDVWHRLFGQDVTLWGPTHLMLIGGASLATLAAAILIAEGARAATKSGREPDKSAPILRRALLAGAFLVGLSTVQAEFDFSVPQFRLLFHPVLLMLAASIALVTARIWIGRGGALMAVFGFLLIRGLLTGLVGGVWGQTTPHFPLYLVEALCVEGVALLLTIRRPVLFGAVSGAAIGTFGLAAEWGWSHVWMTMSWPSALLPEAVIFGLLAAVSGGVLGGAIGRALAPPVEDLAPSPRWAVAARGRRAGRRARVPAADLRAGEHQRAGQADRGLRPARAQGRRRGAARPGRRGRERRVVQRDLVAGRRLGRLEDARGLPRRLPHDASRSRSTATGRRPCACTRATSSRACRSSCPRTRRSRPRRSRPRRR